MFVASERAARCDRADSLAEAAEIKAKQARDAKLAHFEKLKAVEQELADAETSLADAMCTHSWSRTESERFLAGNVLPYPSGPDGRQGAEGVGAQAAVAAQGLGLVEGGGGDGGGGGGGGGGRDLPEQSGQVAQGERGVATPRDAHGGAPHQDTQDEGVENLVNMFFDESQPQEASLVGKRSSSSWCRAQQDRARPTRSAAERGGSHSHKPESDSSESSSDERSEEEQDGSGGTGDDLKEKLLRALDSQEREGVTRRRGRARGGRAFKTKNEGSRDERSEEHFDNFLSKSFDAYNPPPMGVGPQYLPAALRYY